MKLEEAINILRLLQDGCTTLSIDTTFNALKLGIEALKYVRAQNDPDHQMMRRPLPGETT